MPNDPAAPRPVPWAGRNARQFAAFLAVGVLNTAFGYGCYALLVWTGLHYGLAALMSTVLGVLFNFRTTGPLVFRSRDNRLLGRFVGVYVFTYAANLVGLWALQKAGLDAYWSGAALLLPMALLSFALQRRFVFVAAPSSGA
jgi:putative flippase GtrA